MSVIRGQEQGERGGGGVTPDVSRRFTLVNLVHGGRTVLTCVDLPPQDRPLRLRETSRL